MPVFISHRTADNHIAAHAAQRLKTVHAINCYIDDVDQRLKSATPQELTRILVDAVNRCTNVLAVITKNTEGSWWVPFELGVAKQAPRVICSITNLQDSGLPAYLMEWPRLRGETAIDEFAKLYKLQQKTLAENILEKRATASVQFSTVEAFEKRLKSALGQ